MCIMQEESVLESQEESKSDLKAEQKEEKAPVAGGSKSGTFSQRGLAPSTHWFKPTGQAVPVSQPYVPRTKSGGNHFPDSVPVE